MDAETPIRILSRSCPGCAHAVLTPLHGAARHLPPRPFRGFGFLGEWVGFRVWALAIFLWALAWHTTRIGGFPGDRKRVQARRDLVTRGLLGPFYFGAILGTGLLTEAATPLVHAGPLLALGWGPTAGIAYGVGFALGRADAADASPEFTEMG
jgi:hypothetical protein